MKKFFASLIILAVFGGVVFYIGWTQFRVSPGKVGFVISKLKGVDESPVQNGEFYWNPQFLLPTNAELKSFTIEPLNVTKTVKGQLPSGEIYSAIYNTDDTFAYEFEFSISVNSYPEGIINLLKMNKITCDEDLREYLNGAADTIAQLAADYYLKKSQESLLFRPESVRRDDLLKAIKIYNEYPEVELSTFALIESKIPDFNLYRKVQNQYLTNQSVVSALAAGNDNNTEEPVVTDLSDYQF